MARIETKSRGHAVPIPSAARKVPRLARIRPTELESVFRDVRQRVPEHGPNPRHEKHRRNPTDSRNRQPRHRSSTAQQERLAGGADREDDEVAEVAEVEERRSDDRLAGVTADDLVKLRPGPGGFALTS
jgi:hypothetical protein